MKGTLGSFLSMYVEPKEYLDVCKCYINCYIDNVLASSDVLTSGGVSYGCK